MRNLCVYGVVQRRELTVSGYDEIHAAFRRKKDAVAWLKVYVPNPKERKHQWQVVSLLMDL